MLRPEGAKIDYVPTSAARKLSVANENLCHNFATKLRAKLRAKVRAWGKSNMQLLGPAASIGMQLLCPARSSNLHEMSQLRAVTCDTSLWLSKHQRSLVPLGLIRSDVLDLVRVLLDEGVVEWVDGV